MNGEGSGNRKGLLVLVTLAAVAVWGGVLFRLTGDFQAREGSRADTVRVHRVVDVEEERREEPSITYRGTVRDPFRPPSRSVPPPDSVSARHPETHLEPPPPAYTLAGFIGGTALLASPGDTMHFVREGEQVGPYHVIAVGSEHIILSRAGRRDTLHLR